jgi:hypothetical protein
MTGYIVTAPPGGLGHFLARVLSSEYDFTVSDTGSYHDLSKNYKSLTSAIDGWDNKLIDSTETVICIHNFDNRDLTTVFSNRLQVDIIVDGCWEIYLNNFYRKAIASSATVEDQFLKDCQKKFLHINSVREEFFFLYQHLSQGTVHWLPTKSTKTEFKFSYFYNWEKFYQTVQSIVKIESELLQPIWEHFITAQQHVIDRTNQYVKICNDINTNVTPTIPENFDNIDFGIMSGMYYLKYQKDILNLGNDQWV